MLHGQSHVNALECLAEEIGVEKDVTSRQLQGGVRRGVGLGEEDFEAVHY